MIKDRTYRLAVGTWVLLAVFFLATAVQAADVPDDLNSSIASPEDEADTAVVAETDDSTVGDVEDGNEIVTTEPEMETEPVTPSETATVTEPETVIEVVEDEVGEGVEEAVSTVCLSGCYYSSIQAAIDAAKDGDVVEVESGTYNENLVVDKAITLKGVDTGEGAAVVNAQGSGSAVILETDGITLEGLYITNAGPYPKAGIEISSSNDCLINKCEVWNCKHWGIYLKGGSNNNIVSECVLSNNGNDGIMMYKSPGNLFRENIIGNNGYNGIYIFGSDNNVVDGNVLSNNNNTGVFIRDSQNSIVMNNIIAYNKQGINLTNSGIDRVGPNRFLNNTQDLAMT